MLSELKAVEDDVEEAEEVEEVETEEAETSEEVAEDEDTEEECPGEGHNSNIDSSFIVQCTSDMAAIDAQRKTLNRQAADIRESLKDRGLDTDAFKDVYSYYKKKRSEREGYDADHKLCFEALAEADTGELFAFQNDKE